MTSAPHPQERCLRLPGTRLEWQGIRGWLDTVYSINRRLRPSAKAYARADRLYRALQADDIRRCRDLDALDELFELLRSGRYVDAPLTYGLFRALSRPALGELIVETDNHRYWVRRGCPVRSKGPTLDPSHLPDDRLDALIQTHADLSVVERLREEKRRRLQDRPGGTDIQGRPR